MTLNQIPIQNIYYLLSYAWNKLEESKIVSVQSIEGDSILNLFAKVLANGMTYIMRRGLDRGYVTSHEQISSIRGRIDIGTTLKATYFRHPSIFCDYDELNYDILHNQIVRTTISKLLHLSEIDNSTRDHLHLIESKLRQIAIIPLTKRHFSLVQLHGNNYFYDFLLRICELIFDNLLVSEEYGATKFRDFLRDDTAMGKLFEEFVRNFFRIRQSRFAVGSEIINWQAIPLANSSGTCSPA